MDVCLSTPALSSVVNPPNHSIDVSLLLGWP